MAVYVSSSTIKHMQNIRTISLCNPFIYEFQVVLYNANLTNLNNLTGDQIGSYFGYSVASGDLNGDGLDDVIIGAPMWTNYQVMGKFETGKVFVAYQSVNVSLLSDPTASGPILQILVILLNDYEADWFYLKWGPIRL